MVFLDTGEGESAGDGEAGADGEVSGRLLQVKALGRVKVWPSGFLTVMAPEAVPPGGTAVFAGASTCNDVELKSRVIGADWSPMVMTESPVRFAPFIATTVGIMALPVFGESV